jgi:hypothetical protein
VPHQTWGDYSFIIGRGAGVCMRGAAAIGSPGPVGGVMPALVVIALAVRDDNRRVMYSVVVWIILIAAAPTSAAGGIESQGASSATDADAKRRAASRWRQS